MLVAGTAKHGAGRAVCWAPLSKSAWPGHSRLGASVATSTLECSLTVGLSCWVSFLNRILLKGNGRRLHTSHGRREKQRG